MKTVLISLLIFLGVGEKVMAIEEPQFTLEKKTEFFEVRNYGPILVAQTRVKADFDDAGNKAFKILADFIFGNNKSQSKIDMTAPVSQQTEKIAMTAPVSMTKDSSNYIVQFTMPSQYTKETLPVPNDPRVEIVELPSRRLAVYRYSGSWSEERYQNKLKHFKEQLSANELFTKGEPVFSRYNSPFSLWFLRRNEIWFELNN